MRPTRARVVIVAAVAACFLVLPAGAQPPTGNAALRYWMAFALLQDPPADAATTDLVQRVADGKAPWDESRLGPILDANGDALEIMRRGSTVRSCDWGIEYDLGPTAPIAHLAKARVLGRLNVLSGMRRVASGQRAEAVDSWLAGIRFSQHLAEGGTLISLLSANSILMPTLNALADVASRGALDAGQRKRMQTAVQALPETGFDWADAMRREGDVLVVGVRMKAVPNLRPQDVDALRATVTRIADALRLPPDRARTVLATVNLGSFPLPSPTKINGVREDVRAARQKLLDALTR
jgi:hypothetical protein